MPNLEPRAGRCVYANRRSAAYFLRKSVMVSRHDGRRVVGHSSGAAALSERKPDYILAAASPPVVVSIRTRPDSEPPREQRSRLWPSMRRQIFCAPATSLKTMASAVLFDRQPFDRMVRCLQPTTRERAGLMNSGGSPAAAGVRQHWRRPPRRTPPRSDPRGQAGIAG